MSSSYRRCPFCKTKLWPHKPPVGRQEQNKLAGVVHWLQVCPVPKCRCPSSQADLAELLGRWEVLVKLCVTHSSLMEKSPPWNFLEQNLVLLRSCFCKSRSCRDDWVEFRRVHKLCHSGPFWICNRLFHESCINLVPFLAKLWPPHLALQIWG